MDTDSRDFNILTLISGFWTPYYTFAFMNFLGNIVGFMIRIDMSVTIVAMVNQSEILCSVLLQS